MGFTLQIYIKWLIDQLKKTNASQFLFFLVYEAIHSPLKNVCCHKSRYAQKMVKDAELLKHGVYRYQLIFL